MRDCLSWQIQLALKALTTLPSGSEKARLAFRVESGARMARLQSTLRSKQGAPS